MPAIDDTALNILAYIRNIVIYFKGIYSLPLTVLLGLIFTVVVDSVSITAPYCLVFLRHMERISSLAARLSNCEAICKPSSELAQKLSRRKKLPAKFFNTDFFSVPL